MIEEFLDKHIWNKMEYDSEWWTKGFIVGVVLTAFTMYVIMK